MVRVFFGVSALLVVSLLGCSAGVGGGGSSPGDMTSTGTGGTGGSDGTGGSGGTGGSAGTSGSGGTGGNSSTSGGGGSAMLTCAELEVELPKERQAIMSCTADVQCGQELKGTSCGCTRNLVARLDADATRFYELLEQWQTLECEEIIVGTCDCPNANGFACKNGFCTWNYVP
ncbi:hypothetical protein KEG38_41440 [Polyangium jinanense]|uniref:hypothetical protein n=1 Tax=Polyangium jinanense TaxID=2829994 RepID=UPI002341058B|nr:hypothetical protein [Polyangium jinanense]MDC3960390.1 hypothetical protein [Polyangium jinanense]